MPGIYFNPLHRVFLNLSGGTVTGNTIFTQGVGATYLSGDTIYSGNTNLTDVIVGLIAGSAITVTTNFLPLSGGTGGSYYFTGDTTATTISVDTQFGPSTDNTVDIGTPLKRFRDLNIVNGVAVNYTATTRITTSEIKLGNILMTETSVIITGNTLNGGDW